MVDAVKAKYQEKDGQEKGTRDISLFKLMTTKEAARQLSISVSALYELMRKREISYYQIGGRKRFTEEDLREYLEACRIPKYTMPSSRQVACGQRTYITINGRNFPL